MYPQRIVVLLSLAAVSIWAAACSGRQITQPAPKQAQATLVATIEATAPPLTSTASPEESAIPTLELAGTPTTVETPVPTPEAIVSEEDCMGECHIPDPNEYFAAGAKPMPASHDGRTRCLVCHTTTAAPALPATHLGRLDEACLGCHKLE